MRVINFLAESGRGRRKICKRCCKEVKRKFPNFFKEHYVGFKNKEANERMKILCEGEFKVLAGVSSPETYCVREFLQFDDMKCSYYKRGTISCHSRPSGGSHTFLPATIFSIELKSHEIKKVRNFNFDQHSENPVWINSSTWWISAIKMSTCYILTFESVQTSLLPF